ncbi:MAG TPA: NAD-dependent epimerase/dehydratase family protein [Kofleriaceae bacterium]
MTALPIVVVTGGAGFIGSHAVDRLLETEHRVVVLDNFSTGKRANLARWLDHPALHVVPCDVAHGIFAALEPITREHGEVERIVHLAAQVSVVQSIANPMQDMQVNYGGTLHVLEYARARRVKKVVFASSAAVYGDVAELPVPEDAPCRPLSPYGAHKLASERALDCYAQLHRVPATVLRFFNVYGPRQDPSSPYSGVISIFTDRARAGRPLVIFGDGAQTRDFVFVGDVVTAIVAALAARGDGFTIANVGTGGEVSVLELARTVIELCGHRGVAIEHVPPRAGEILKSRARVDRLRDVLGVVAQTSLHDGLREILAD